jgi:hypothetical protein
LAIKEVVAWIVVVAKLKMQHSLHPKTFDGWFFIKTKPPIFIGWD